MTYALQGDMREVLRACPAAYFDCVVADPPYGETSLAWDRWPDGWPAEALRVLKPTGSMWVFGSLRMFMRNTGDLAGWKLSHDVVWEKQNGTGFQNDRFRRVHEYAAHFYPASSLWRDVYKQPQFTHDARNKTVRRKERPPHLGEIANSTYVSEDGGPRLCRSVLAIPNMHGRAAHPTQKPEELVELLLAYACPPGGVVLDPFAGSGTTGRVAARLGVEAVLIEADPAYFAACAELAA